MACMTPAAEGTRISIDDPEARGFRASVIEWLMINHPHDCPVCDEGGECHLQDMTVMTGHDYRRYRFTKRTHRNQDLGPFINHEMNRCIQCYRCVRFYRDYAGGRDFDVFGCHDDVYFGRHADGTLESEFSGNLVEVCPTGVFTDKTLMAPLHAQMGSADRAVGLRPLRLGCNTIPGERYGELRRIRNRYNREVNGYFLCDRGRFGYEFVNGPERLRAPMVRQHEDAAPVATTTAALRERLAELCAPPSRVVGIGSPRASLEVQLRAARPWSAPSTSAWECRSASGGCSSSRTRSSATEPLAPPAFTTWRAPMRPWCSGRTFPMWRRGSPWRCVRWCGRRR